MGNIIQFKAKKITQHNDQIIDTVATEIHLLRKMRLAMKRKMKDDFEQITISLNKKNNTSYQKEDVLNMLLIEIRDLEEKVKVKAEASDEELEYLDLTNKKGIK